MMIWLCKDDNDFNSDMSGITPPVTITPSAVRTCEGQIYIFLRNCLIHVQIGVEVQHFIWDVCIKCWAAEQKSHVALYFPSAHLDSLRLCTWPFRALPGFSDYWLCAYEKHFSASEALCPHEEEALRISPPPPHSLLTNCFSLLSSIPASPNIRACGRRHYYNLLCFLGD